jgi:hypothetical protein
MKTAAGEYDDNHGKSLGNYGGIPWQHVVNYITNPKANTPPNKAAGAHYRWSQSLNDNGNARGYDDLGKPQFQQHLDSALSYGMDKIDSMSDEELSNIYKKHYGEN